ncbi:MAG: endolytic transglycosylase MltG [Chloroflexi bacterium]|nr:endolytic transglycosylase MltG [Chloroflexota bacterium]
MTSNKVSKGKGFLLVTIFLLILIALCLIGGIAASIPARTSELYGQPDPDLSPSKLYQQSLILLLSKEELLTPLSQGETEVFFPIAPGEPLDNILTGLQHLDLIQHTNSFRAYLIYSGLDTRIQPGDYLFPPGLTEVEIAELLGNPVPQLRTVTILAGWRMEEIAENLNTLGLDLSTDSFLLAGLTGRKEGYLFPGSYQVPGEISAEDLITTFYERFISYITTDLETNITNQGLSLHQAVILASIIEREAVLDEEMPQIASVFLNRFRENMNLAADPTIQYALGYNEIQGTWWTNPLSLEDLKLPSSYNTYENPGLPPGPICNPGLPALQAVASPAETTYFYFRAACDGSGRHLFAETFDEHLANACQ